MKYVFSKKALADLEQIWLYTFETWSKEQADRYFNLIIDEVEHISQNPESGTEYSHVRVGYFRSRVKSHFIFYKINSVSNEIEVVRILHQQMDIESRLYE
jgi:toxin ParE1/3/4